MSELLTQDEYQAIAKQLDFPTGAFIDGKSQVSATGESFATLDPATGNEITQISVTDEAQVNFAVEKAREAFKDGRWSKLDPGERKAGLVQLAKLIKRNARELAVLESLESGKPIADIETVDIPEAIDCLLWHAESIDKIYDQVAPTGDDVVSMIVREPIGVVACVLPKDFFKFIQASKKVNLSK